MTTRMSRVIPRLRNALLNFVTRFSQRSELLIRQADSKIALLRGRYAELSEFLQEDIDRPIKARRPEDIHETLRVVYARSWLPLVALGVVTCLILIYLIFGKIPITSKGNAMFLSRGTVVPLQSTVTGQITSWRVSVGDSVVKGQLLATLGQPLRGKILEQQKDRLQELSSRTSVIQQLEVNFQGLETEAIVQKREVLDGRIGLLEKQIAEARSLAKENNSQKLAVLRKNEQDVTLMVELSKERVKDSEERLSQTQSLQQDQLKTVDEVILAASILAEQRSQLLAQEHQLTQFTLRRLEALSEYSTALDQISEMEATLEGLKMQYEDLDNSLLAIRQRQAESDYGRDLEIADTQRMVRNLEKQVTEQREIRSEFDGRILELSIGEGEVVAKGFRLGTIDTTSDFAQIEAVAYFKLGDGKKIRPGMRIRLNPATVQRERFGSLIAEVTEVSPYPVTTAGVATIVGNASVAASLTAGNHQIEVFARLLKDEDTRSGYQWDLSEGPDLEITPGTVGSALVDLRERPPITFVIPILRGWDGFW